MYTQDIAKEGRIFSMFSQSFEHCKMPTGTERVVGNPVHSSEINKIFNAIPKGENRNAKTHTIFETNNGRQVIMYFEF